MGKLLIFTENYSPGGGNRYLIDMANAIGGYFEEVIIMSNCNGIFPDEKNRLKINAKISEIKILSGFKFRLYSRNLPDILRYLFNFLLLLFDPIFKFYDLILFYLLIKKNNPDFVFCFNGGYPASRITLLMAVISKMLNRKVLLSIVSMPFPRNKILILWELIRDYLVFNKTDLIIVNADAIAESLTKLRGFDRKRIFTVHNGLEINPSSSFSGNLKKNDVNIGNISRMDRAKGIEILIDAFCRLTKKYNNIKLILAGHQGDASKSIRRKIAYHKINNQVAIKENYSENTEALLKKYDIFVYPSWQDGFPYCILEAMRSGLAIISTNVGGIPEAITHEKEGLLVKAKSIDELENAISRLIEEPEFRKKLAENSKNKFMEKFTIDIMNKEIQKIFRAEKIIG